MPCDRPSIKKIYCGGREWGLGKGIEAEKARAGQKRTEGGGRQEHMGTERVCVVEVGLTYRAVLYICCGRFLGGT